MTVCNAVPIVLSAGERQVLILRACRSRGEQRDVLLARVVLAAAAASHGKAAIAVRLAVTDDTVREWRGRFAIARLAGLQGQPRSGRPRTFPAVAVTEVKAMACALQAETGCRGPVELAAAPNWLLRRSIVLWWKAVSASTVRRWMAEVLPVALDDDGGDALGDDVEA